MQEEGNEIGGRRSTRDYVVNDRRAEILAAQFEGVFSAVDIREALEGEPVAKGLGLLNWASKKRLPMKALRAKAKKDGLGYYRPRARRPDAAEEYRRCMAFVRRKQGESLEKRGRPLSPEELDDLTREFYAPMHRAAVEGIPEAAWDALHRELEEEEVA